MRKGKKVKIKYEYVDTKGSKERLDDIFNFIFSKTIEYMKMEPKRKCLCNNPTCAKCLGVNCVDDNCLIHTKERKEAFRLRWEATHDESFPEVDQEK